MKASRTRDILIFFIFFIVILLSLFLFFLQTDYFDPKPIMKTPPTNPLYMDKDQTIENRVADLLSYMTLEEKIGQMILIERDSIKKTSDISKYNMGGLLSGSGSKPEDNTAKGWKKMIDGYQAEAKLSRLGIPLLYGSDGVHGHAHVPGATVFPHAIGLGASNDPDLVKAVANATAKELSATGVNWNFSPNLDQPQDIRWGRVYETFSDDPVLVSKLTKEYIEGLQENTDTQDKNIFVLASPKHFIGLGAMEWNTSLNKDYKIDQGITFPDQELLRNVYLPPFKQAIDSGALNIMVGLNKWGDKKMVLQKELLTGILKQELGFKGFLVSDWYGVDEGRRSNFLATVQAVNSGVDMVMLPFDYKVFFRNVKWANRLGLILDNRIDDAVGRILYAKFALGLFDEEKQTDNFTSIASPAHKTLAREAVFKSLVLLKNEDSVLPLSVNTPHIRVAGSAADNVGRQMGAWSIDWQGIDGEWPVPVTSILDGIKSRVSSGTKVEYDITGDFRAKGIKAPIGIAVVGENPYAEGWGDREHPILSDEDLLAIKNLQASCEKVIVITISGRPLLIKNEIASFDALVSAWLPGSEGGEGIGDVIFGYKPFVGTLPLPWPSHVEQLPITTEGVTADNTPVLFPRYFGL